VFAPGTGRWVAVFAALSAVLLALLVVEPHRFTLPDGGLLAGALALTVFLAVFFRDPERSPGEGVVSAADGRVREIVDDGPSVRVSVFMNVTNVHVNRVPYAGTFAAVRAGGAGFRPAYRPDAGRNVSRTYFLATELGPVRIVQVTGVLARRLVSFVATGDRKTKGERFGMILLGSRVDVLLPRERVEVTVKVGDRVVAGVTTIARVRA
jgi:phosphatidylserine decarboxylase